MNNILIIFLGRLAVFQATQPAPETVVQAVCVTGASRSTCRRTSERKRAIGPSLMAVVEAVEAAVGQVVEWGE